MRARLSWIGDGYDIWMLTEQVQLQKGTGQGVCVNKAMHEYATGSFVPLEYHLLIHPTQLIYHLTPCLPDVR